MNPACGGIFLFIPITFLVEFLSTTKRIIFNNYNKSF